MGGQARGDLGFVRAYAHCVKYKLTVLLQMAFGLYTHDVVEGFGVRARTDRFVGAPDSEEAVSDAATIASLGKSHPMFWLIFPGGGLLTKIAELFAEAPLFVAGNARL